MATPNYLRISFPVGMPVAALAQEYSNRCHAFSFAWCAASARRRVTIERSRDNMEKAFQMRMRDAIGREYPPSAEFIKGLLEGQP